MTIQIPFRACELVTESAAAIADGPFALALLEPPPRVYTCPFRVVACTNEGIPYRFTGMRTDASDKAGGNLPIIVEVVRKPLYLMGRQTVELPVGKGGEMKSFLKGLADYSIDGLEEEIQIERKSKEDLFGTLGGRRDEFEAEIARIGRCKVAAVFVESEWTDIFQNPPSHSRLPPKVISRTVSSWTQKYPMVHWFFCAGRQHAEAAVFRHLEMFWRHRQHEHK